MWILQDPSGRILAQSDRKADVIVEAFSQEVVARIQGESGKRHLRLKYGYKIREIDNDAT